MSINRGRAGGVEAGGLGSFKLHLPPAPPPLCPLSHFWLSFYFRAHLPLILIGLFASDNRQRKYFVCISVLGSGFRGLPLTSLYVLPLLFCRLFLVYKCYERVSIKRYADININVNVNGNFDWHGLGPCLGLCLWLAGCCGYHYQLSLSITLYCFFLCLYRYNARQLFVNFRCRLVYFDKTFARTCRTRRIFIALRAIENLITFVSLELSRIAYLGACIYMYIYFFGIPQIVLPPDFVFYCRHLTFFFPLSPSLTRSLTDTLDILSISSSTWS